MPLNDILVPALIESIEEINSAVRDQNQCVYIEGNTFLETLDHNNQVYMVREGYEIHPLLNSFKNSIKNKATFFQKHYQAAADNVVAEQCSPCVTL